MILESGGRRLWWATDQPAAGYVAEEVLTATADASPGPLGPATARVAVEVLRRQGGMAVRALLGGELRSRPVGGLAVEVAVSGTDLTLGADATCPSELGPPLVPGLPRDFGPAVLAGAREPLPGTQPLPPGTLRIDRSAYDEVGSGNGVFRLTAGLLVVALGEALAGRDASDALRAALASAG